LVQLKISDSNVTSHQARMWPVHVFTPALKNQPNF
jgi:hypothetical protein